MVEDKRCSYYPVHQWKMDLSAESGWVQTLVEGPSLSFKSCYQENRFPITFSVCLSIISSYLFLVLSASWSSQAALTLLHSLTHSLFFDADSCSPSALCLSSALSHPTQPTFSPGKRLSLSGGQRWRDEWMNGPLSSSASHGARNILAKWTVAALIAVIHIAGVYCINVHWDNLRRSTKTDHI